MGIFFDELIGAIVEAFFDIIGKSHPDDMPDIEYKSEYIIKEKKSSILAEYILSVLLIVGSLVGFWATHHDTGTRPLFIIFAVLALIILSLAIYSGTLKYTVTEEKIIFKKKCLYWNEIICVRDISESKQRSHTIALYDKNGKCALTCATDMENAWHLLKTAEKKEIEVRKEKDLTVKQINHL